MGKRTRTWTLVRLGGAAAVAGGLLWVIKFTVIALRDDSFEPLESVVFVGGLVGIIFGTVALAALVARGESPWLVLLVVVRPRWARSSSRSASRHS